LDAGAPAPCAGFALLADESDGIPDPVAACVCALAPRQNSAKAAKSSIHAAKKDPKSAVSDWRRTALNRDVRGVKVVGSLPVFVLAGSHSRKLFRCRASRTLAEMTACRPARRCGSERFALANQPDAKLHRGSEHQRTRWTNQNYTVSSATNLRWRRASWRKRCRACGWIARVPSRNHGYNT